MIEAFDLARLQKQLRPLDLTAAPNTGDAEAAYFRFYGIDFEHRIAGVTHWFGHFSSGRYEIVAHYFEPQQPVGTCFVLHGYFDHVGLFRHVIDFCLRRGLAVVAYDLPGHGLSTGERAAIQDFAEYRQVLTDAISLFSERAPRPWRAIAQSTGGAVLMDYLLDTPEPQFTQSVLLAPLVRPALWRGIKVAYSLGRLLLDHVPRRFAKNSSDEAFVDFLAHQDPLQDRTIPLSWIRAMLTWERRFAVKPSCVQAPLVIQGQYDLTVSWRHNLSVIRHLFPRARILQLAAAHHQLANECEEIRYKIFAGIDLYWSNPPVNAAMGGVKISA